MREGEEEGKVMYDISTLSAETRSVNSIKKLEAGKEVSCNTIAREKKSKEMEDLLNQIGVRGYMRIAARANYVAVDRPDIQLSVKEICRQMSNPDARDWRRLQISLKMNFVQSWPTVLLKV